MSQSNRVFIVPVVLEPHPDADTLSVVKVEGYTCVVKTEAWQGLTQGAYIPPDSLVKTKHPQFSFLPSKDGVARIKAQRLRGVWSFGLLVPFGGNLGEDVTDALEVEHYEPPPQGAAGVKNGKYVTGGEQDSGPDEVAPKYDLESLRKYHSYFREGEPVVVTEKLDGCNARYVFSGGRMHCGSRTEWKKEYPDYSHLSVEKLVAQGCEAIKAVDIMERLAGQSQQKRKNLWWSMLDKYPGIESLCRWSPGTILYGESYGSINCIKYGLPDGDRFAAFDMMSRGRWWNYLGSVDVMQQHSVPTVPLLSYHLPYSLDAVTRAADGPTLVRDAKPGTIREGVVVRPIQERSEPHVGRIVMKCVGGEYLSKHR